MEENPWKPRTDGAQYATVLLLSLCLALSAASLIFGLLSCTRIKKWRQLHNYVFLQVITASVMYITTYFCMRIVYRYDHSDAAEMIIEACFNVMVHWHLATTLMFYLEFVRVITVNITLGYLYLLANLFTWLLPVIEGILCLRFLQMDLHFMEYVALMTAIVNCLLYISVLYVLMKNAKAAAITTAEVLRHFLVSTITFFSSGVTLLVPVQTVLNREGLSPLWLSEKYIVVTYLLNLMAITVCFLSMKNHRELWLEYRRNRSRYRDDVILVE